MPGIKDLFKDEELTMQSDGNYKTICPDCGLQGGRTEGFILFPDTNMSYCHSSHKTFNFLETAGLKLGLIKCLDGKDSGVIESVYDNDEELINETFETIEEVYGMEMKDVIMNSNYNKKEICLPVTGKLISTFSIELGKIISDKNILFYRNDIKQVVEIKKILSQTNQKYNGFTQVTPNRFITLIERYVSPGIYIKNKKTEESEFHKKSLNSTLAAVTIESHYLQDMLPKITRIFTVPIPIMYNGELTFPSKGYDKRFESWLPYTSPEINTNMNLEEAKDIIKNLYSEFCFKEEDDKTNAIAALLSPFLKGLFKTFNTRTPVPFYIANRERAGKDYLAGITGIVYEGAALEEPPVSNNDNKTNNNDELRKKILSAMIAGRKRMHFSNNKGYINNAVFESIATASQFSDRALGRNETLIFDNELDLSLSGNVGISYTPDFANRCRFINLFLDIEDANSRVFKNPDLHGWVKDNRSLILSAMFALVRNWKDKGFPCGSLPFTSFQEWAIICGGIMESAGYDSPCKQNALLAIGGDKETNDIKRLFEICYKESKGKGIGREDIISIIKREELFPYYDFDNKQNLIKFGIKLSKFVGRIFSDIKLQVLGDRVTSSRQMYFFEDVRVVKDVKVDKPAVANQLLKSYHQYSEPSQPSQPSQLFGQPNTLVNTHELNTRALVIEDSTNKRGGVSIENKPKQKSDREVQFFDAEECKTIVPNHTKEDILKWIKENPNYSWKVMYDKFGVGSFKFERELQEEGLI